MKRNITTKVPSTQELIQKHDPKQIQTDAQNKGKNPKDEQDEDEHVRTVKIEASHLQFFTADDNNNESNNESNNNGNNTTKSSDFYSVGDIEAYSDENFDTVPPLSDDYKRLFRFPKPTVRFDSDLNVLKTHSEVIRETADVDASSLQNPDSVKSIMKVTKDYYRIEQLRLMAIRRGIFTVLALIGLWFLFSWIEAYKHRIRFRKISLPSVNPEFNDPEIGSFSPLIKIEDPNISFRLLIPIFGSVIFVSLIQAFPDLFNDLQYFEDNL